MERKKNSTPKMVKRIELFDITMDRLDSTVRCFPSDIIEKEGAPKDGYLFGYEYNTFCKETSEGSGLLYWYPPEPPNPIEWFPYFTVCGGKLKFRHMKPDEESMVNSVILASIHDEEMIRRNRHTSQSIYCNESYTGQYFDRDKFLMELWWYFDKPDSKKQTQLELALQNVRDASKTELAGGSNSIEPAGTGRNRKATIAALIISLFVICIFLLSVWLIPFNPFTLLKNHPNSYPLQGSIICLIICVVVGLFKPKWRKTCWGSAVAFVVLILTLA